MKKVIITTGEHDSGIFEEEFHNDEEIIAYLEGERAGANRWVRAWVQEDENIFRDYEDPTRRRSIPQGAICRETKKTLRDKEGAIIGHYRINQSSPLRIFVQGKPFDKTMTQEDPNLQSRVDEIVAVFRKGWNEVQDGKESLERWGIRVERDIESIVYYQEYSLK